MAASLGQNLHPVTIRQIIWHTHPVFLIVHLALPLSLLLDLLTGTLLDVLLVGPRGEKTLNNLLDAGADLLASLPELGVIFLLFPGMFRI